MSIDSTQQLFLSKMMQNVMVALSQLIPIFGELTEEELQNVARYMFFLDFKKGDVIFYEGDKGDFMCFVVEGLLEVTKSSPSGDPAVVSTLCPGEALGEMAVIDEFPRSATVTALEPARLLTLTRGNFDTLLEKHPRSGNKIIKAIARLLSIHLRKTSSQLADHSQPLKK